MYLKSSISFYRHFNSLRTELNLLYYTICYQPGRYILIVFSKLVIVLAIPTSVLCCKLLFIYRLIQACILLT